MASIYNFKVSALLFSYGRTSKKRVRVRKGTSILGYTQMDLGIAKYHFEIGAGKDNFEWVWAFEQIYHFPNNSELTWIKHYSG